jgi:hypothetical protein
MSHWAEVDENNIVIRVTVGDNNDPAGDEGYQWLVDNLGGTWIKTSYNGNIRKNFAAVGSEYNPTLDAFIPVKPIIGNCIFNQDTCKWQVQEEILPTEGA